MKIITNEGNPAVLKLLIAARLSGRDIQLENVSLSDKRVLSHRSLPLLELDSGVQLLSVNQAGRFLLPPPSSVEIQIDQWIEWDASLLQRAVVTCVSSPGKYDHHLQSLLATLDASLSDMEYLLKGGLNIADICIWSTLFPIASDPKLCTYWMGNFKNVLQWWLKLQAVPAFEESVKKSPSGFGVAALQAMTSTSWYALAAQQSCAIQNVESDDNKKKLKHNKSDKAASQSVSTLEKDLEQLQLSPVRSIEGPEWDQEIKNAKSSWEGGIKNVPKLSPKPVLPVVGERNVLITSALPYVNNVPHLGNIIGCVLSADVFSRYCRLRNYNTLYIGGTDEYGTATETKALEEGLTPQEICNKYFAIHSEIYHWFNISFDLFGRTTFSEQTELTQNLFLRLHELGYMFIESVEQLLCQKCDRYLADRFVEGTCPKCSYEDARGDQCDGCGTLINATELIKPHCKLCGNTPIICNSDQFFIDFPKIEPKLLKWFDERSSEWSHNARVITKSWLREGLRPRCITRDLKWGVPVPIEKYSKKVFYVWFDAPVGYMSMTKRYTDKWLEWWQPKENCHVDYFQFMAKDNVPFHALMFPSMLLASDNGYTTASHIMATEYLNYEDGKFSKSRGTGVFGNDAKDTGIPADCWRFYLLFIRPESQDSSFCWDDLALRINTELLNNLGNFVNRALSFVEKNFSSTIPEMQLEKDDLTLLALVNREIAAYIKNLELAKLRDGVRHILSISRHGNQYVQAQQPWVKAKGSADEKKRAGTIVGVAANIACLLSVLLHPYMPAISRTMQEQMNASKEINIITEKVVQLLKPGHKIGKPFPLFTKIEQSQTDQLRALFAGKQKPAEASKASKKAEESCSTTSGSVLSLKAAVDKQANLVREMKASGKSKSEWQPHVDALLQLKSDLSAAQKAASSAVITLSEASQTISAIEEAIKKQGDVVRELKAKKKSKAEIQPDLDKLLELKKNLAALQPTQPAVETTAPPTSSGKNKNKNKK